MRFVQIKDDAVAGLRLHIVRHLHEAVDLVRREEAREKKASHPSLISGTRYLFLKNPWNLTDKQSARLSEMLPLNLKIIRAYMLKEVFRDFWTYKTKGWAKWFLTGWFWWATHSRLSPMRKFAWMLRRHQDSILTYVGLPITNATVEGLNNKAKVVSHRCYGFRTAKTFITNLRVISQIQLPPSPGHLSGHSSSHTLLLTGVISLYARDPMFD